MKVKGATFRLFMAIVLLGMLTGCDTEKEYKEIPYFKDVPDSIKLDLVKPKYNQLLVEPDDILSISVMLMDPSAAAVFAQPAMSPIATSNGMQMTPGVSAASLSQMTQVSNSNGYLVNKNGDVSLPILGTFHLMGYTTSQAEDSILARAEVFYKNPTVYVRFANFKVTVLGEVAHPGQFVIPNEKANIFDALGLAGDLTIFGKRDNVLLIRDSADQEKLVRLNLNSKNFLKSDYFYLKQNDVLYVEPAKSKLANLDAARTRDYTVAGAILSVLIIIATRL